MMNNYDIAMLRQKQSLSLASKLALTKSLIKSAYAEIDGALYLSVSGRDSIVMSDIVKRLRLDIPPVFFHTGLEWPEIVDYWRDKAIFVKPKMSFREVLDKYGFPVISKEVSEKIHALRRKSVINRNRVLYGDSKGNGKLSQKWLFLKDAPFLVSDRCCYVMKKYPAKHYEKISGRVPCLGVLAEESRVRFMDVCRNGCKMFHLTRKKLLPLSFWLKSDILQYVKEFDISVPEIYNKGWSQTGCVFCLFGIQSDVRRFERMAVHYENLYTYCMDSLKLRSVVAYLNDNLKHKIILPF